MSFGQSLLGLAAAILLILNGDVMGASGITSSVLLQPKKALNDASQHWKLVFLAIFFLTSASATRPSANAANARTLSTLGYAVAGLLTGFGTKVRFTCSILLLYHCLSLELEFNPVFNLLTAWQWVHFRSWDLWPRSSEQTFLRRRMHFYGYSNYYNLIDLGRLHVLTLHKCLPWQLYFLR
jgi:hypothetical protein